MLGFASLFNLACLTHSSELAFQSTSIFFAYRTDLCHEIQTISSHINAFLISHKVLDKEYQRIGQIPGKSKKEREMDLALQKLIMSSKLHSRLEPR